jgi:hypothetical protein
MALPLALSALAPYISPALQALGVGTGLYGALTQKGQPSRVQQLGQYTPEQQSALNSLLSQGMQNYNPQAIANQARTNFNQQTIPTIAERFTAMGGGQRSSAFTGALGSAASNLEQSLAALQSNMGQQQLQMGLTPQFENLYHERQPGFTESIGAPGIQALLLYLLGNQSNQLGNNYSFLQNLRGL